MNAWAGRRRMHDARPAWRRASGSAAGRVACLGRGRSRQRHDRTSTVPATGEAGDALLRSRAEPCARGGAGRRWMRSTRPTRRWASGWAAGRAARWWRTTPAACARRSRRRAEAPGPRRAPERQGGAGVGENQEEGGQVSDRPGRPAAAGDGRGRRCHSEVHCRVQFLGSAVCR